MTKIRLVIIIVFVAVIAAAIFVIHERLLLRKAHSTFENYYAFRGCSQLISRTADSGTCRLNSGQVIKIVKFNNKWYLDGDLPLCWHNFCF
jgi:hypothetical protein